MSIYLGDGSKLIVVTLHSKCFSLLVIMQNYELQLSLGVDLLICLFLQVHLMSLTGASASKKYRGFVRVYSSYMNWKDP